MHKSPLGFAYVKNLPKKQEQLGKNSPSRTRTQLYYKLRYKFQKIRMVPTPTTLIMLILGISTFIFIMLLPALLELKRPRDAGPRAIMDNIIAMQSQMRKTLLIIDVEEGQAFDKGHIKKIMDIIAFLPNLEV